METTDPTSPRRRWRSRIALFSIAVVLAAAVGQWWFFRPKRAAEHFVGLVSRGQVAEAVSMLRDAAAIRAHDDGSITILGADGSKATLADGELPLISLGLPGDEAENGFVDQLAGRYWFQVGSSGPRVHDVVSPLVEVHCVADGSQIVVERVR